MKLTDFTPFIWASYFSWLSKQISTETKQVLAQSTVDRIFAVLCSVFTCAKKWQYVKTNSVQNCRSEYTKNKRKRVQQLHVSERCLSYDEALRLIDALKHEDLKYQLIVHFAIVGGLRRSEILGIKWDNVDFSSNVVHIAQSSLQTPCCGFEEGTLKNSSSYRSLYMPSTTMNLLKKYKNCTPNTDNNFVLVNNRGRRIGKRLSPSSVTTWFRRFREKNGLPEEVPLHGLRHTCATILIAEGINITNVSARLGHSRVDTTLDVYSHPLTNIDRLACDTLEKVLYEEPIEENSHSSSNFYCKRYTSQIKVKNLTNKVS